MTEEKGKKITIDELAKMMKRSFDHLEKKIEDTREDVKEAKDELKDQLEKIENKIDTNHENRISRVEDDIRIIKTTLGIGK